MRRGHLEVGVTETPKNPQVIIRGGVAMKAHIGNFARNRGGGVPVQKIGGYR